MSSRASPADTLSDALADNVHLDRARLFTDEHKGYTAFGRLFALGHETVFHHGGEYVRGEVTTDPVENYFGQLKRSIDGTHHAVRHEHLHRYVAEFDFRFSTRKMADDQRAT